MKTTPEFLNTEFNFLSCYAAYAHKCNDKGKEPLGYNEISQLMYPDKFKYHLKQNKLEKDNVRWTYQEIFLLAEILGFKVQDMKEFFK